MSRQPGDPFINKEAGRGLLAKTTSTQAVDPPHPGTVVAYNVPLSELVKLGKVRFRSKGEFFGDAVSITIDNTQPPPGTAIDVKLYLEFWGPYATMENITPIVDDIVAKWAGAKTSGGVPVNVQVIPKLNPYAATPPGSPGYHQIELVPKDSIRSNLEELGTLNEGTTGGQWELGLDQGGYAHEVGHLMGLPDQYDDYVRQPNGGWTSASANKSFADDAAFAQHLHDINPVVDVNQIMNNLKNLNSVSVPKEGHFDDMMARHGKPLRQSDIDAIAAQAGLFTRVHPGEILVSRSILVQNILVTHAEDIFVPAGKSRTLNGLFGACVDHDQFPPSPATMFDLAPPLNSWNGVSAAPSLAALARHIDTSGIYCGNIPAGQSAIWRITDDVPPFDPVETDAILLAAGINAADRIYGFPHLTGSSAPDSAARIVVPNELFPADIHPRRVHGQLGKPATFRGNVSKPSVPGFSTSFSWIATDPNGMPLNLATTGDSASLTPGRSGVYEVGLNTTVQDSIAGPREFPSIQRSQVVVPDSATETFESLNLTHRYRWETYGDAPWTISPTSAHTGTFSAQAGYMTGDQVNPKSSSLEIRLSWPRDTAIVFAMRILSASPFDRFEFRVDSLLEESVGGYQDWKVFRMRLDAGERTLTWRCIQLTPTPAMVWVDNIFLPAGSVVTSTPVNEQVPLVYSLAQNYPNPFNPTTVFRYQLPAAGRVKLAVYDLLGREVAALVDGTQKAGTYEVPFDGRGLASGVYIYRLVAGDFVASRKMVLAK
jgi:hypothetical protein